MTFPPRPKSSNWAKGRVMNVDSSFFESYPHAMSDAQIDPALVPATFAHSVIGNCWPSPSVAPSANCKSAPNRPRPFTPPPWNTPSARFVSSTCDISCLPSDASPGTPREPTPSPTGLQARCVGLLRGGIGIVGLLRHCGHHGLGRGRERVLRETLAE